MHTFLGIYYHFCNEVVCNHNCFDVPFCWIMREKKSEFKFKILSNTQSCGIRVVFTIATDFVLFCMKLLSW